MSTTSEPANMVLFTENNKLVIKIDSLEKAKLDGTFWDIVVRQRVEQLRDGEESILSDTSDKVNDYDIAITELSKRGLLIRDNKKEKLVNKKISSNADFQLSQSDSHLIIEQVDGPPFDKDTLRNNRFFCAVAISRRIRQLNNNIPTILDIESGVIADVAKEEFKKGIYVNGQFVSNKILKC